MQAYNEVLLEGVPTGTPERSHENHGQVFYRQFIEVPRLSGTADLLPMLLRQEQLLLVFIQESRCESMDSSAPSITAPSPGGV